MTPRAALLGVVLLGASLGACSDDEPKVGEARLDVDGEALIERVDGDQQVVTDDAQVRRGDRVTLTEGTGALRLRGGTVLELRDGSALGADRPQGAPTSVRMGRRPVLEAGDLLVTTPDRASLQADGTDIEVEEGAARVSRRFGMAVSSYDAAVSLDSAGQRRTVPPLRRMAVPDLGRPPRSLKPVAYDERDTWDRRFLGEAMDLGARLDRMARGLTAQLPDGEGRTVGFFKLVLPGLEDEAAFTQSLIDLERAPGDTLVGAAIAELGERRSFTDRWDAVFDFRDDGAEWGIVALDQAVRSAPLVGTVEDALDAGLDESIALGPSGSAPPGAQGGGGSTGGGGPSTTPPSTPTSSPPTTAPPTTGSPPTTEAPPVSPPTTPPPLEPVLDPVGPVSEVVEDLIGGLLGGG